MTADATSQTMTPITTVDLAVGDLSITPVRLASLVETVSGDVLRRRPRNAEWTPGPIVEIALGGLARVAVHSASAPVTPGHVLHDCPAHDLTQLGQIERSPILPFLPGIDPWADGVDHMLMR